MPMTYCLSLPYPPVTGNHAARTGLGRTYSNPEYVAWCNVVGERVCGARLMLGLRGPLAMHLDAYPPDRRARDYDNLRKVTADALTKAGVWIDDSNKVLRRESIQWHAPMQGGALEITITEITAKETA